MSPFFTGKSGTLHLSVSVSPSEITVFEGRRESFEHPRSECRHSLALLFRNQGHASLSNRLYRLSGQHPPPFLDYYFPPFVFFLYKKERREKPTK
ncbi:hypothetical protein CDAR_416511 [Caerostris darwini]|uniref:Uncharacterized protein n=1 Tax=Caerostris darwini TaxID=1538125 RepID=A0AAV4U1G4_9ARAC|nr:hypothetical protein CDAR_416511 [Caerostris darwini]